MTEPIVLDFRTFARIARSGPNVEQIFQDLERQFERGQGGAGPRAPKCLLGMTLDDMRTAHDNMVAQATIRAMVRRQERRRAIRSDRRTLLLVVATYPLAWAQISTEEAYDHLARWGQATVGWAQLRFGPDFAAAYQRGDQMHPEVQLFMLPLAIEGADAEHMRQGCNVLPEMCARLEAAGLSAGAALRPGPLERRGNVRALQLDYQAEVMAPFGFQPKGRPRRDPYRGGEPDGAHADTRIFVSAPRCANEARQLPTAAPPPETPDRPISLEGLLAAAEEQVRSLKAQNSGIKLAFALFASGQIEVRNRRLKVSREHYGALLGVWPDIGPTLIQIAEERLRWQHDLAWIEYLLRRDALDPELRAEAEEILGMAASEVAPMA